MKNMGGAIRTQGINFRVSLGLCRVCFSPCGRHHPAGQSGHLRTYRVQGRGAPHSKRASLLLAGPGGFGVGRGQGRKLQAVRDGDQGIVSRRHLLPNHGECAVVDYCKFRRRGLGDLQRNVGGGRKIICLFSRPTNEECAFFLCMRVFLNKMWWGAEVCFHPGGEREASTYLSAALEVLWLQTTL